ATFTWTAEELREVIGPFEPELFFAAYGVTDEGNWEGKPILSRVASNEELKSRLSDPGLSVEDELISAEIALFEHRQKRPQAARDGQGLGEWSGLAIGALADAGRALEESLYLDAAVAAADGILAGLRRPD